MAVAVFDDRIEVRSTGTLPRGITAAMLSHPHESILRNPLIAGAFHRTGAVEVWGRGTNRVIEECERWGIEPPSFEVVTDSLWVTFPAVIGPGVQFKFRDQVIRPLLEAGYLEMTIPDKPRSSKQSYRTTEAGRRMIEEQERG